MNLKEWHVAVISAAVAGLIAWGDIRASVAYLSDDVKRIDARVNDLTNLLAQRGMASKAILQVANETK